MLARIGAPGLAALALGALVSASCMAAEWTEPFDYGNGSAGEPAWEAGSAQWVVRDGRMMFEGGGKDFLALKEIGYGRRVTVEATVRVSARRSDGWALAGVAIHGPGTDHWHLALVESPEGNAMGRFAELVESYGGAWLANYEGETRLTPAGDAGGDFHWEYDRPYRLSISMTPEGIEGRVSEPDGTLRRHLAFRFDPGVPAIKAGRPALDAALFMGHFDDVHAEVSEMVTPPEEEPKEFPTYDLPGCEQVQGEKTGFFHAEKQGDTWWLIDPNGRGFYAVGTDHINYHAHWCEQLGYAPHHRNVERKYGSEENWAAAVAERLEGWGFNLLPAGHSPHLRYTHFAHTEWLGAGRSFADVEDIAPRTTWTGFPNVFSPRWRRHCEITARRVCAPNRDDPYLLGYFLDNELQWFGDLRNWQDEFGLWTEAWKKPPDHTAKQAWMDVTRRHCADVAEFNAALGTDFASFEELAASGEPRGPTTEKARAMAREFVRMAAELYFRQATEAIRRHDPNHMVLGCRFAGWSPGVWDIAGRYCDVVSFNSYPRIDVDRGVPRGIVDEFRGFHEQAGKPLMITEWSFPALDSGLPCQHGAGMRVATQQQKARCFRFFQSTMFGLPFMVGSDYFMYVDEPALGISSTFPEDSNYGLVKETDEPWPELTAVAAELNPQSCRLHRAGELTAVFEPEPLAWSRQLPPLTADSPALPPEVRTGPLTLRPVGGSDAWTMLYEGAELGAFYPLLYQQVPANHWVGPDAGGVTAVREDEAFVVVDMTFTRAASGGAAAYAAGWRFWVPRQSSGWFGAQPLWVENSDVRPWTLAGLFHYTRPAIGGSAEGDDSSGVNVPNFYIPVTAWEDPDAGLGQGAFGYGGSFYVRYWKDDDGFHSDCMERVNVELAPTAWSG
ncbi:MAG: hypothetical protein AMK73_09455 [Planctomycetes bacterium SM23_32]|nr:MAG: hypothetical protein AMK73_09455 [Planctomycetes bacterium SM23_32]